MVVMKVMEVLDEDAFWSLTCITYITLITFITA